MGAKEVALWNLARDGWAATQLGKAAGRDGHFIEQSSFFLSLLPHIYDCRPHVIYFSDGALGNLLWHWRRLARQKFKLLYSNGGPLSPSYIHRMDHAQQVAPTHLQAALDIGVPREKQSLLPYGIKNSPNKPLNSAELCALRGELRLPENRSVLLSVGAINKSHKRMDYVIHEVASLPEPRPYLLLLGQLETESPELIQLGHRLLDKPNFDVRTVRYDQIADYYRASDLFILASLGEGFGRVFLEAMSYGLPCIAHDCEITRFVLGEDGCLRDLSLPENLAQAISEQLLEDQQESKRYSRQKSVYERFSWEKLLPHYLEMIKTCAGIVS
ncbi:glycosyltransferase family 4 protein [Leptolyngbya sp. FACHB-261]|uniref:glycosyltransferase family 4 protein n=1 Tax=Leptolyngbya sp. FACHB-261 TaxID=2692806 RepID=UPI001F5578C9|nr:glycosyltransferase family 4 protein [Leptolyngbya sp. FACHB-261]